jgi:hypothetical protein
MDFLRDLAERKITAASMNGAFVDLPGTGTKLDINDAPLDPSETRTLYRVLKNAGFLPREVERLRAERDQTRQSTHGAALGATALRPATYPFAPPDTPQQSRRWLALEKILRTQRGRGLACVPTYRRRILEKLLGRGRAADGAHQAV